MKGRPMAALPKENQSLETLIYQAYEKKNSKALRLTRIGASGIGEECLRSIWYDWRGFQNDQPEGRILRLFKTGHIQEDRTIQDLKDAGLEVWEVDPDTGEQWTYTAAKGHFVCKTDGALRGVPGAEKTPHVIEIKSSNAKGFKELQSRGVKEAKPVHYWQMQSGMWLSGLTRAIYIAVCKDDEKFYIERVEKDDSLIEEIQAKLEKLVNSEFPPIRIAEKEGDWRCKFCDSQGVCWGQEKPLQNCRTCQYSRPTDDGKWFCDKFNEDLDYGKQLKGCDLWTTF
jgi:hypothetical protein